MSALIGLDVGGTKCAVSVGARSGEGIEILSREEFPTAGHGWRGVLDEFARRIEAILTRLSLEVEVGEKVEVEVGGGDRNVNDLASRLKSGVKAENGKLTVHSPPQASTSTISLSSTDSLELASIGISCGGPLDSAAGLVLSPPNLPGWDRVPVVDFFAKRFGVPVALQNDANACALAEWRFGAGRGTRSMVFMTFGTGLGAGIVIDGKIYSGANDNAGEIGHIRLAPDGPVGYNKAGSAEGFCSGAGIARLAKIRAGLDVTAKELFARVRAGDPACTAVFRESAEKLATILAYTIDILNPEVICLGGVFMRNADLFFPVIDPILDREVLPLARKACRILPAGLGERVGDFAALAIALSAADARPLVGKRLPCASSCFLEGY